MTDIFDTVSSKGDVFDMVAGRKDIFDTVSPQKDVFDKVAPKQREGVSMEEANEMFTAEDRPMTATLEAVATMATAPLASIYGGIKSLASPVDTGSVAGDLEEKARIIQEAQEKYTYQPKTEGGKEVLEMVGAPFEVLEKGAEVAGDVTLDVTGSPTLATAIHTGVVMSPMLLSPASKKVSAVKKKVSSAKATKKINKEIIDTAESDFLISEFKERFVPEKQVSIENTHKLTRAKRQYDRLSELKEMDTPLVIKGAKDPIRVSDAMVRQAKDVFDMAEYELMPKSLKSDAKAPVSVVTKKELNWTPKQQFPETAGTKLYSGLPLPEVLEAYKKTTDVIWDVGVGQKLPMLLEKIPGGKSVNRALLYDYRGDLAHTGKYIKSFEAKQRSQQIGKSYAIDIGNRLSKLPEKAQLEIGEYLTGKKKSLPSDIRVIGEEAKVALLDLGKQAVDAGLLSEKTFFENAGRYMPRLYTKKEYNGLLNEFGVTKPNKMGLLRFKKRKNISKEIREEMGEILTPAYPVAKGITQLTHDIEQARWFNNIASNKDWALPKASGEVIPNGWKQLPTNKKLGTLSEANVHPEIYKDITNAIKTIETPEKVWRKALGAWKFGKVVASPKTHARNLMSNSILSHLGGMPMYEQPVYLSKAVKAMKSKGNSKYWKDATREGLLDSTWTENELTALFSNVESQLKGIKANGLPEKLGVVGGVMDKGKKGMNKMARAYQAEEEWFKIAKYIHNIERRKMTPKVAAKDAEKWLFNYAKVTKAQDAYRSKWYGAPFATFTIKALPRIAEAAVKTPHRFILPGAMIYGLEKSASNLIGDTKEQQSAKKELRPKWMQGEFMGMPNFARTPIVDESGREYYLNLSYILPWGDIGESSEFGGIPGSLMPMSQPFLKESWQQIANYDSFWESPIVSEDDLAGKDVFDKALTQAKKRGSHVAQTLAPTPVLDIIKGVQAKGGKPDYRGRMRPPSVVAADAFFGVKLYPVDYVEEMVRRINKINPTDGSLARKLKGQMKTLEIKRRAVEKRGGDGTPFKKQIEEKINQIKGLAKESKALGETYKKIQ